MAEGTELVRKLMSDAFREEPKPTRFLTGFFKSPPEFRFDGEEVEIDAIRGKEEFAIDVAPNSGGRANKANIFTTKKYKPPGYDEYTYITAEMLQKRLPGRTAYDLSSYSVTLADLLVNNQVMLRDKIIRAIELQSRDGLLNGKIVLINGDEIDFNQKASHQFPTPLAWTNSLADPLADFAAVGNIVRKDGVVAITDAIFGEAALSKFLNNANVIARGDLKQIELFAIASPIARDDGAAFHGQFTAGSYKINIWSYPQFVRVPLGFGLPNEGTKVPYIPTDKIFVLPTVPDFRLYFAGVPSLTNRISPELMGVTGLDRLPSIEKIDMLPYFRLDQDADSVRVGVRSRPVAIPVGIDQFAIITVT
jgi:hypothetical protein